MLEFKENFVLRDVMTSWESYGFGSKRIKGEGVMKNEFTYLIM